jgi:hypothetical protein
MKVAPLLKDHERRVLFRSTDLSITLVTITDFESKHTMKTNNSLFKCFKQCFKGVVWARAFTPFFSHTWKAFFLCARTQQTILLIENHRRPHLNMRQAVWCCSHQNIESESKSYLDDESNNVHWGFFQRFYQEPYENNSIAWWGLNQSTTASCYCIPENTKHR